MRNPIINEKNTQKCSCYSKIGSHQNKAIVICYFQKIKIKRDKMKQKYIKLLFLSSSFFTSNQPSISLYIFLYFCLLFHVPTVIFIVQVYALFQHDYCNKLISSFPTTRNTCFQFSTTRFSSFFPFLKFSQFFIFYANVFHWGGDTEP